MQLVEVARSRSVNWSKATPTGVAGTLSVLNHYMGFFFRISSQSWTSFCQSYIVQCAKAMGQLYPGMLHAAILNL